ncbi:hypothetical protein BpHYR1_025142 [Brachionus plicatilis]|uniref:Uncharacterized protein n=1 Tax=Brachionus plicatilis TaxID=10195 RepID=A0A3M7RSI5_BRAPC|nr:hypothetical protein BpHYR1_025142 [Brachionus plicatilis]
MNHLIIISIIKKNLSEKKDKNQIKKKEIEIRYIEKESYRDIYFINCLVSYFPSFSNHVNPLEALSFKIIIIEIN